jgi:organic hydroperoxide reductase OsmC/OhrA
LPVDRELAQERVDEADQICPSSRAAHGNADVTIDLV